MSLNCFSDPLPILAQWLDGSKPLSSDQAEILIFALYLESLKNNHGLAHQAQHFSKPSGRRIPLDQPETKVSCLSCNWHGSISQAKSSTWSHDYVMTLADGSTIKKGDPIRVCPYCSSELVERNPNFLAQT